MEGSWWMHVENEVVYLIMNEIWMKYTIKGMNWCCLDIAVMHQLLHGEWDPIKNDQT